MLCICIRLVVVKMTVKQRKKYNAALSLQMSITAYLCEVRVGVEATLVAHHAAALRAGVEVRLVIPGAHQVGGFADGAQFAAGHGCNLWHRVRGGGDAASVRGHRGGPPSPAATHIHLQTLPGHMTLALFSLRCGMLRGVVGGQSVPCPRTTLDSCFRSWVWRRWSGRDDKENTKVDIRPGSWFRTLTDWNEMNWIEINEKMIYKLNTFAFKHVQIVIIYCKCEFYI